MKITLSLLLTLAFATTLHAQLINPDFETWSQDLIAPPAMNPNSGNNSNGWWSYNMFNASVLGSSPVSVFRCDTAHSGSYSVKIKSVVYTPTSHSLNAPWGVPFIGHSYLDTLGILFTGTTNETPPGSYKPGIPFNQKIATLSFWYQYYPQGNDTAECRALLVKNMAPQGGGSVKLFTPTGSTWQQATIQFNYIDFQTPDSLFILISSSSLDHNPIPGSTLLVDDMSVSYLTGVSDVEDLSTTASVFPNPTNGNFQFDALTNRTIDKYKIEVHNLLGEKVYQSEGTNPETHIHKQVTLNIPDGIYFLTVYSEAGMFTKKIQITR